MPHKSLSRNLVIPSLIRGKIWNDTKSGIHVISKLSTMTERKVSYKEIRPSDRKQCHCVKTYTSTAVTLFRLKGVSFTAQIQANDNRILGMHMRNDAERSTESMQR